MTKIIEYIRRDFYLERLIMFPYFFIHIALVSDIYFFRSEREEFGYYEWIILPILLLSIVYIITLTMLISNNLMRGSTQMYIRYKALYVHDFSKILCLFQKIYTLIFAIRNIDWEKTDKIEKEDDLFSYLNDFLAKENAELQVASIHTGHSIKWDVTTGYLPKFDLKDKDLIVKIPEKARSLYLTVIIVSAVIIGGVTLTNGIQDIQIKELEKEKLRKEIEKLNQKNESSPEIVQKQLLDSLNEIRKLLSENENILSTSIRVDKIGNKLGIITANNGYK